MKKNGTVTIRSEEQPPGWSDMIEELRVARARETGRRSKKNTVIIEAVIFAHRSKVGDTLNRFGEIEK